MYGGARRFHERMESMEHGRTRPTGRAMSGRLTSGSWRSGPENRAAKSRIAGGARTEIAEPFPRQIVD